MTPRSVDSFDGTVDFCTALMSQDKGGISDDQGFIALPKVCEWARLACARLKEAGLVQDEPVLVPTIGAAEDVAGILAVISAGGVAVPIHERAHPDTFAQICKQTCARFSLSFETTTPERGTPRLETRAGSAPAVQPLLRGAAMITFTSGSTGSPKGVVLSLSRMTAKLGSLQSKLQMSKGAVSAVPLQLIFSFGQWATFLTLLQGGTVLMSTRFDAEAISKMLADGKLDYLAAVPTMLRMLLDHPGAPTPFTILTGGEAVNSALRNRIFESWLNAGIYSIYGLTESGTCDLFHYDALGINAADTLGRPAPGVEVSIVPETSELLVKTPFAMLGYLNMPEETNAALGDGWLRTGDMARILPSGDVQYSGRLKEVINRAGNKVSPQEIEVLFAKHPNISEVLATGAYDHRLGEAIHLLVVPCRGLELKPNTILEWAKGKIDRFKLPDHIHFGETLPVGQTGKVDRRSLRARIEQGLQP